MIEVLSHIVKTSAIQFPDREAYRCGDAAVNFIELDRITDQLANYLVSLGVDKGDRVGLYLPRCIESVIGVYGIMKAGAAFVPLDPLAPASRIKFLIEDCGIKYLVTGPTQSRRLKKVCASGVSLTGIIGMDTQLADHSITWEGVIGLNVTSNLPDIQPNDLAYVMYTSGSTGAPKGIMHTHASGLNYARLSAKLYHVSYDDRVAGHAPLHFDISTFSYFTAPLAGACTIIIPEA